MGNLSGYDVTDVHPAGDFEPIPAGTYTAMISSSEWKQTKDGRGSYLYLVVDVVDGEFEGRRLFDRLNLDNPNPKAVEIARRTLSSICHAVGVFAQDSSELHDRPMRVKVVVKPEGGGYPAGNEIKGYSSLTASGPSAPAAPAVPAKPAPPWKVR